MQFVYRTKNVDYVHNGLKPTTEPKDIAHFPDLSLNLVQNYDGGAFKGVFNMVQISFWDSVPFTRGQELIFPIQDVGWIQQYHPCLHITITSSKYQATAPKKKKEKIYNCA